MKRILWVSTGETLPFEKQRNLLAKGFGDDIEIVSSSSKVYMANKRMIDIDLLSSEVVGFDDVLMATPKIVCYRFFKASGVMPLIPIMVPVSGTKGSDLVSNNGKRYIFKGFKRFMGLDMVVNDDWVRFGCRTTEAIDDPSTYSHPIDKDPDVS